MLEMDQILRANVGGLPLILPLMSHYMLLAVHIPL